MSFTDRLPALALVTLCGALSAALFGGIMASAGAQDFWVGLVVGMVAAFTIVVAIETDD